QGFFQLNYLYRLIAWKGCFLIEKLAQMFLQGFELSHNLLTIISLFYQCQGSFIFEIYKLFLAYDVVFKNNDNAVREKNLR
ncbi:hypothetical protein MHK_005656, partial [Candidatus Magnetomorum sp. HK-1]